MDMQIANGSKFRFEHCTCQNENVCTSQIRSRMLREQGVVGVVEAHARKHVQVAAVVEASAETE